VSDRPLVLVADDDPTTDFRSRVQAALGR